MLPLPHSGEPGDSGRASLEFLTLLILVFLPVLYFALSLASLQGASLATEAAARNAVRVFTEGAAGTESAKRAEGAVRIALANHGLTEVALLERQCSRPSCLEPGTRVTIRVGVNAPIFSTDLLPGGVGAPTRLVVAEASGVVSDYGGQG